MNTEMSDIFDQEDEMSDSEMTPKDTKDGSNIETEIASEQTDKRYMPQSDFSEERKERFPKNYFSPEEDALFNQYEKEQFEHQSPLGLKKLNEVGDTESDREESYREPMRNMRPRFENRMGNEYISEDMSSGTEEEEKREPEPRRGRIEKRNMANGGRLERESRSRMDGMPVTPRSDTERMDGGRGSRETDSRRKEARDVRAERPRTGSRTERTVNTVKPVAPVIDLSEVTGSINSVNTRLEELASKIAIINAKVDTITAQDSKTVSALRSSVERNKAHEDNMFEELESYRKDKDYLSKKPYMLSIVGFHQELLKSHKEYVEGRDEIVEDIGEKGYEEVVTQLTFFVDMVESAMKAHLITYEDYEIGSDFINQEQKMIKTIKTTDEELNGKIAEVISGCYKYDNRVLKEAVVVGYKYN